MSIGKTVTIVESEATSQSMHEYEAYPNEEPERMVSRASAEWRVRSEAIRAQLYKLNVLLSKTDVREG